MGNLLRTPLLSAALCMLALPVLAATPREIANQLLDHLDAHDYAAAEALFTAEMAAAVPADKLQAVWESLPAQAGEARGRGEPKVMSHQADRVVVIPLNYARAALQAQVVVTPEERISGFLIQPAPAAAPALAEDAGLVEQAFTVAAPKGDLPATLALPKGMGPFPAVVLVHGSGPQDRDETIGPNRPFLDIARGLAAQGVAVLRYDKRSKVRPQDFADGDFDMDDETTDDAMLAVRALAGNPAIDPGRIFILGHSQGGMLAPRIGQQSGQVAGLILFAAPARSLLTLLPEQNRYLLGRDGQITTQDQAMLDDLDRRIAAVRGSGDVATADSPLGVPASYWRAFEQVDPVADALASSLPMLLLQGGRDFQVIDTDWQRWQQALASQSRATLKHYPALNHLGIAGEGKGSLAEYGEPGHVDAGLIDDIALWVKAH